MGDVKRYSYSDLKAKHDADGSSSELHQRPAPAPSQEPMQPQAKGLEAELSSVWSIMKNVNAAGLTVSSSGDGGLGMTTGSSLVAQGGALPGLTGGNRTNYYSRYGGLSKGNPLANGKRPVGDETATTAIDAGGSTMRFPVQSPQPVHGVGSNKPTMAPKDEWRSFRTK